MRIWSVVLVGVVGLVYTQAACADDATVVIKDRQTESAMVIKEPGDYLLQRVNLSNLHDSAALTLSGQINSVTLENCQLGGVLAGPRGKAVGLEAVGAVIGTLTATDSTFYDAENQLVSLRDGSFGTVTFLHCTFKTSNAFLKRIYGDNPWRTEAPVAEFYNIDRLELLDNDYSNTTIVIHPSVKTVVFRGDISHLQVESPDTQVINLSPGEIPDNSTAGQYLAAAPNGNVPVAIVNQRDKFALLQNDRQERR